MKYTAGIQKKFSWWQTTSAFQTSAPIRPGKSTVSTTVWNAMCCVESMFRHLLWRYVDTRRGFGWRTPNISSKLSHEYISGKLRRNPSCKFPMASTLSRSFQFRSANYMSWILLIAPSVVISIMRPKLSAWLVFMRPQPKPILYHWIDGPYPP